MASALPAPAIGIDLGTTFSCVAVFINGKVEIIKNQDLKSTMPSYVAFTDNGRIVGERAKQRALIDPENTVNNMKRLIGRTLDDRDVAEDITTFPFRVVDDGNGNPNIKVQFQGKDTLFRPEEISAAVLTELKTVAEEFLGQTVQNAVITVPAYFTDAQRQATMDAGRIAGLNVLGTINEPTAAALAYGFDNTESDKKTALVYDFGGGTFDVSILNIENGAVEVLSTGGSGHLGGEDIDTILLKHCSDTFKKKQGNDLLELSKQLTQNGGNAKRALRRIRFACEKAKIKLSSEREARIEVDLLYDNRDLEEKFVRRFFETLCEELIRSTIPKVTTTIEEANLCFDDISEIILVGGSTRIPMVTEMLKEIFPNVNICGSVNPDEAVAYGAAIQAAILSGVDQQIVRNVHLRDVTPMSLGIETFGGIMATIIPRNTPVPVTRTKVFSTSKDYQTEICFQVFEGERHLTKHNNLLGEFTLVGVPPAPRRVPQIEVSFEVNENGILQVRALDLSTESENGIDITNNRGRLNPDEIARAVEEAKLMRQQDLQYKKKIQARETLEIYANKIERTLKISKIKEKMTSDELQKVENLVDESLRLYESYQNPDETNFEDKRVELERQWLPIIKRCYPERRLGNPDAPVQVDDSFFE